MLTRLRDVWWRARDHAAMLDTIRPATWCLDRASIDGGELTLCGWIVRAEPHPLALTVNGRPCDDMRFGIAPRPDVRALYSFAIAESPGFECRSRLDPNVPPGSALRVDLADARSMRPLRDQQAFFLPSSEAEIAPLPDDRRMRRVHGSTDPDSFRLMGFSTFEKLDAALRRVTGNGIDSMRSILDWGCGCGRLLRYCSHLSGSLTGVDIDADNLSWCQTHLPYASYQVIPLHPPSGLPAAGFDLVIGISVFTHLNEAVQFEWLGELKRVLSPGGLAAVTIHGPTVAAASGSQRVWRLVREGGFLDARSHDLDEVLEDKHYYRTTFHSHDYVRREWSRYFEIVDIIPACIGNAQDLVVLRRT